MRLSQANSHGVAQAGYIKIGAQRPAQIAIDEGSDLVLPAAAVGRTNTSASLSALAKLHRHAELMRRLSLTPTDYFRALRLLDRDPFADPGRLADFVAAVDRANSSPLSVSALAWLCRFEGDQAPETL